MSSVICTNCLLTAYKIHMFREMAMKSNILLRQRLWKSRKQQNADSTQIVLNSQKLNVKNTVKEELLCTMTTDDMEDDYEFVTVIVSNNEHNDDESIDCILENAAIGSETIVGDVEPDDTIPKVSLPKHRGRKPAAESDKETLTCHICDKTLSNPGSYRYHMQLHSDRKPFLCTQCGEGFKTRNAYDGHMTIHLPTNPNKCDVCGKTYRQAASLRCHMLTHTGEKVGPKHCSHFFERLFEFQNLLYVFQPFTCDICGKSMTQKSGFKVSLT